MISRGRHSERITAAATALLLQAALYLALSPRHLLVSRGPSASKLVAMILTATRPHREPPPPPLRPVSPRLLSPRFVNPEVQPITPLPRAPVSGTAIDWQATIQHEVGDEISRANARPKVRFGFPQLPAQTGPTPAFGWDETHTDRIQRLAHGIIDLGPCTIKLYFPIPICHFGDSDANGDLFKNMQPRSTAPGSPP